LSDFLISEYVHWTCISAIHRGLIQQVPLLTDQAFIAHSIGRVQYMYIQVTMNCHLSNDEPAEQGSSDGQQTYHTK